MLAEIQNSYQRELHSCLLFKIIQLFKRNNLNSVRVLFTETILKKSVFVDEEQMIN